MLTYLIDGFNLFHKVNAIRDSLHPHIDLVLYIKKYNLNGSRNNRVIIVFDGASSGDLQLEREFEIVYSNSRTADDVIKDKIRGTKHKKALYVVTDDREIIDCAKSEGTKVLHTAEFLAKADQAPQSIPAESIPKIRLKEITEELEKLWVKK